MDSLITPAVIVVAVIFPILSTLCVALRFKARKLQSQKLLADDWTIVIAMVMCWGQAINVYITASLVGITKVKLNPIDAASVTLRALWISSFFFYAASTFVKISIILFYKRIFATPKFQIASWIMVALLSIWGIGISFSLLFTATPITDAWNVQAHDFNINLNAFHLSQAWTSLALDVIVLCFPFPMIRGLQMPTKKKVLVMLIFWLGAFCCVAAAVRIYFLYAEINFLTGSKNAFFSGFPKIAREWIWSKIEPNTSVIAACLPSFRPLFAGKRGISLESLMKSMRSFITLKSESRTTVDEFYAKNGNSDSMKDGLTTEERRIELKDNLRANRSDSSYIRMNDDGFGNATDLERGSRV